jgi:hypothetical protein
MSAVSKNVMPQSRARFRNGRLSASSSTQRRQHDVP